MNRSLSSANFFEPGAACESEERFAGPVPDGSKTINEIAVQITEMLGAGMDDPPRKYACGER